MYLQDICFGDANLKFFFLLQGKGWISVKNSKRFETLNLKNLQKY